MPRIPEYFAPDRTLRPSDTGFSAFETAGRRIGPLYREAGQDMARIGELQRQGIEARRWPFDILALEQRSQGGGGIRVRLGRDPMNQFPGGTDMSAHHADPGRLRGGRGRGVAAAGRDIGNPGAGRPRPRGEGARAGWRALADVRLRPRGGRVNHIRTCSTRPRGARWRRR